jgi:hypothetical protein
MKKNELTIPLLLIAILIVLSIISLFLEDENTLPNTMFRQYTPGQILHLYIDCLNNQDHRTLNKTLSKGYLERLDGGYKGLPVHTIRNVDIKPVVAADYLSPELTARYGPLRDTECYYAVDFDVVDAGDGAWLTPGDRQTFFVKLVLEHYVWKIDEINTGPAISRTDKTPPCKTDRVV